KKKKKIIQCDLRGLSRTAPTSPSASQPHQIILPIVYPLPNIPLTFDMPLIADLLFLATGVDQFVSLVLLDCEGCSASGNKTFLESHNLYYMSVLAVAT